MCKKLLLVCFVIAQAITSCAQSKTMIPQNAVGISAAVDIDFEPKTFVDTKTNISLKVWITVDGLLHCKTTTAINIANIYFVAPNLTMFGMKGYETKPGMRYSKKYEAKKDSVGDYIFDIKNEQYKAKYSINFSFIDSNANNVEVKLINKKVPERMSYR